MIDSAHMLAELATGGLANPTINGGFLLGTEPTTRAIRKPGFTGSARRGLFASMSPTAGASCGLIPETAQSGQDFSGGAMCC